MSGSTWHHVRKSFNIFFAFAEFKYFFPQLTIFAKNAQKPTRVALKI